MRIDKDNIKIILILLVVCLGIGYSYLNTELNINGTANINSANWSVYWNNVQVESGSISAPTPTIDSDKTTVSYTVTLEKPGDYYEFTVDAVNAGTIDAMIETINTDLNGVAMQIIPEYLDYSVTYADNVPLEYNQELLHDSTEKYKVHIGYADYIEAEDLPDENQSLSLEFTVTYKQADNEATEVPHSTYTYTVDLYDSNQPTKLIQLGQAIPSEITQYTSASDALAALRLAASNNNINFYLKHTVQGGVVTESYVEFVVTTAMASSNTGMTAGTYTLRGAGATYNAQEDHYEDDSPYYESNKATLLSAFGSSYCTDYSSDFYCSVFGLSTGARASGDVHAYDGDWGCYVTNNGDSGCDGSA